MENPDLVLQETGDSQIWSHSSPADCHSRQTIKARPDHPEWSLLPEVFQAIYSRRHHPQVDLFATRFNNKLPQFVSLVPSLPTQPANLLTQPFNQILHRNMSNLNLHAYSVARLLWGSDSTNWGSSESSNQISLWSKVNHFTKWRHTNKVDFGAPSIKFIVGLLYLLQDRKLQPSTIDGYRSAITDKLENSTVNVRKTGNLARLLDSFHRDRPKSVVRIPLNPLTGPLLSI